MRIKIICIGKTGKSFLEAGEEEFWKRLKHYVKIERIEIPDIKNTKGLTISQIRFLEGKELLAKIATNDSVFLLDERGTQLSSIDFSDLLQQKQNLGIKSLVFIIGGAYGFSPEIYSTIQNSISLSKMTFSHQMIRMIFLEQLYRAFTILRNEPYHHE